MVQEAIDIDVTYNNDFGVATLHIPPSSLWVDITIPYDIVETVRVRAHPDKEHDDTSLPVLDLTCRCSECTCKADD